MIRKAITALLLLLLITFGRSNGQCHFIRADKFDNVWVVNNSEVVCFDKQFKIVGSYSNILLGNPTYIDPLDPFRVIVFYQNSQSIAILNNAVSEISKPIRLRDKGISDANLVCRSGKGGFWVFNRSSWEILYFDSGFNLTGEKLIPDLLFSDSKPMFMQENNGSLYVGFHAKGICRFDSFGAHMGDIPVKADGFFTLSGDQIIYETNGKLFTYSLENNQISSFNISARCIPTVVQGQFLLFDGRALVVSKIR
jgi:hypothetical protein